jgi:WD40 repeat protein
VTLLDPARETPVRTFAWQGSSLVARWSPSGRYIATGEQDSTVHFWIVKTGQDLQMSGYPRKVRELTWDAKGRLLATGGGDAVTVWDCSGRGPAGSKPVTLPGHEREVTAIEFQRHGEWLASGGADGRLVLWSPTRPRKLVGATLLEQPVSQLAWSPDDRDLVVGGGGGMVALITIPQSLR